MPLSSLPLRGPIAAFALTLVGLAACKPAPSSKSGNTLKCPRPNGTYTGTARAQGTPDAEPYCPVLTTESWSFDSGVAAPYTPHGPFNVAFNESDSFSDDGCSLEISFQSNPAFDANTTVKAKFKVSPDGANLTGTVNVSEIIRYGPFPSDSTGCGNTYAISLARDCPVSGVTRYTSLWLSDGGVLPPGRPTSFTVPRATVAAPSPPCVNGQPALTQSASSTIHGPDGALVPSEVSANSESFAVTFTPPAAGTYHATVSLADAGDASLDVVVAQPLQRSALSLPKSCSFVGRTTAGAWICDHYILRDGQIVQTLVEDAEDVTGNYLWVSAGTNVQRLLDTGTGSFLDAGMSSSSPISKASHLSARENDALLTSPGSPAATIHVGDADLTFHSWTGSPASGDSFYASFAAWSDSSLLGITPVLENLPEGDVYMHEYPLASDGGINFDGGSDLYNLSQLPLGGSHSGMWVYNPGGQTFFVGANFTWAVMPALPNASVWDLGENTPGLHDSDGGAWGVLRNTPAGILLETYSNSKYSGQIGASDQFVWEPGDAGTTLVYPR